MPFQATPSGQSLPPNPDVRIFFQGLLILRASDDSKLCVVENHLRPSFPHTLSIEVRAKVAQEPDVILMRHFGPLEAPGLVINGGYDTASSVVYKHQPSSFDNPLGVGAPDDFRWIVNLEGRLFHKRPLSVDTTGTRPGITVENGIYYFYTARKKTGRITRTGGGEPDLDLTGIASTVGANLSIGANPVVLTWHKGTNHMLELDRVAGTSYEIYIDNSPLFLDLEDEATHHSELNEYYDVLPGVGTRFDLDFHPVSLVGSAKFNTIRSTPNIPCQSIVLETPET
jgi:hypothetical protein